MINTRAPDGANNIIMLTLGKFKIGDGYIAILRWILQNCGYCGGYIAMPTLGIENELSHGLAAFTACVQACINL